MKRIKRGAAYIDTVVTIFISMIMLVVALNLLGYYNAYHKLDYIAQEMLRSAVMHGETTSYQLGQRYEQLKAQTGLGTQKSGTLGYGKTKDLKISFDGSEFIDSPNNTTGAVQRLDTIKVTVQCKAVMQLLGNMGTIDVPMSVTKTGASENLWKTEDNSTRIVNGSSSDWIVDGDRIIQYIGPVTDGMTLIIPNHVDGRPVRTISSTNGYNVLGKYDDNVKKIIISDGIQIIGDCAFQYMYGITEVIFPNTLTTIGNGAFAYTTGLKGDLVLPPTVTTINNNAFYSTGYNGNLILPDSVSSIGFSAFAYSSFRGRLVLPANLTTINMYAFTNVQFSGTLNLPNKVVYIGEYSFVNCQGFTGQLRIPDSVVVIEPKAFYNCKGFNSLVIGNRVTYIGTEAFGDCTGLTGNLTIPNSVETISSRAFYRCSNLTGLTLGNSLKTIYDEAFKECSRLTGTLTIPNSVTYIGVRAFNLCYNLTGLNLGNSIVTISTEAFYQCTSLRGTLRIPDTCKTIGDGAFAFTYITETSNDVLIMGNSVEYIGTFAFYADDGFNCTLTLPSTIKTIGAYAFCDCSRMYGALSIPATVAVIEDGAFIGCSGFTSLSFKNASSIPFIEIRFAAFARCTGIRGTVVLNPVASLGANVFEGCNNIDIIYYFSYTKTDPNTFYGCPATLYRY